MVAVALLGCAVILAIAFQISKGLAMEAERQDGGAGIESELADAPADGALGSGPTLSVDPKPASAGAGGMGEASGAEHGSAEAPPSAVSGLDHTEEVSSTAPEPGNRTGGRMGTPRQAKEINPVEGHTVSPQPADEIGERARKSSLREHGQTRIPDVTSSDPTSPGAPVLRAPAGASREEAARAVEMIRGTRRSTEPVAASENQD